jgi:GntR family transcriptional repressor for pyruvate dehydrogenase complex
MDVGRSTIREALRVLEVEGLIEARRGAGTFVAPKSSWKTGKSDVAKWLEQREETLNQLLQVREYIEGLTASLAASVRPPELVSKLWETVDELSRMAGEHENKRDYDTLADINTKFHLAISEASGNDIAHEIVSHILPPFSESNKKILFASETLDCQVREHHEIVQAIEAGNPEKAEALMRAHISRVRKDINRIMERRR